MGKLLTMQVCEECHKTFMREGDKKKNKTASLADEANLSTKGVLFMINGIIASVDSQSRTEQMYTV